MKGFPEAIMRRPPRANGSGEVGACSTVNTTSGSTSAQALNMPLNGSGAWFTFVCSQDAHIRFGLSTVGNAGLTDWLLRAGVAEEFWCESNIDTHFKATRDTADGTLYWYRSSQ